LITGTPYLGEIVIFISLNIPECFQMIYGSPTIKTKALEQEIRPSIEVNNCLFIGESLTAYKAESAYDVPFMLRETDENKEMFIKYIGARFNDFRTLYESS